MLVTHYTDQIQHIAENKKKYISDELSIVKGSSPIIKIYDGMTCTYGTSNL